MSKFNSLKDLFIEELRDLLDAEHQLIKALPAMAKAASHQTLQTAFEEHLDQTKIHAERLERILSGLDESTRSRKCKAIAGLVAEAEEWIHEKAAPAVKDAGLIAKAQRVEHYEIAGYGCARTYASLLGYEDAEQLLQTTLDEEEVADARLTELSTSLNAEARHPVGTN
ncbi:MAG TPA: ferritin-like domain-containing protein [Opitutaceae bacterium]|jgi:ferritin-like metal-binding protein YciE|nr:ferritin-like domain-containing protein [Opitutaceae bacterium]